MTKPQNNIASFVLRFTQELSHDAQGEPHVHWRGHIRHVQGDEEDRFTDFAEAVIFIQRYLLQLTLAALSGGQTLSHEKVLQESFKMWERFASSYGEMMFQAIEQTAKQSQTFKAHIDQATQRAFKVWQIPRSSDQKQLIEVLNSLQVQMQLLTNKVEKLEQALQTKEQPAPHTDERVKP
jgi:hypothetical protein